MAGIEVGKLPFRHEVEPYASVRMLANGRRNGTGRGLSRNAAATRQRAGLRSCSVSGTLLTNTDVPVSLPPARVAVGDLPAAEQRQSGGHRRETSGSARQGHVTGRDDRYAIGF
jgi:hypothetical protein